MRWKDELRMRWKDYEYSLSYTLGADSIARTGYVRCVSASHAEYVIKRDKIAPGAENVLLFVRLSGWNRPLEEAVF